MFPFVGVSEVLACAGAGASTLYLTWRRAANKRWLKVIPRDESSDLLRLQSLHGYNEHTYVLDSEQTQVWMDTDRRGAVCYVERGNVWLVTGEPLAAVEELCEIAQEFVTHARENRKLVVFLPTSARFARAVAGRGFRIHKIAASPYFDLEKWNPKGNPAKGLRLGINRARRGGVKVEPVTDITPYFRGEVAELCDKWLGGRTAGISFGWLFKLAPFQNSCAKRYFAARDTEGKLVGLLAASPIPAREGWYLEDVLRRSDSPDGTADLLVFEALRGLAADGAKLATLGTVPLSEIGLDDLTTKAYLLGQVLNITRKNLKPIYNIEGLRCFKSKFVPSWWEGEYVIVSKGYLSAPRSGIAILRVIFGEGIPGVSWLISSANKAIRSLRSPRVGSDTAISKVVPVSEKENSLNQKSHAIVNVS